MQQNIVSGVVFDDTNMPLPGVNVNVVGKSSGTTTDFDGNFTLTANTEDSLEFSYIGFKSQIVKIGDKTTFSIVMEASDNTLDEVIIAGVASGTSKKKMSVSVTKVKSEEINMTAQPSIADALSGKIAGASITSFSGSPGSGAKISIRGAKQFGGGGALILLDGVIMSGSLADINSDDIESVEMVKGAAASALYGSKAAGGVIVLTSKRGKKLKVDQTVVTVRSKVSVQQISKYLELSKSHPYELSLDWLSVDNYTKYNFVDYPEGYDGAWDPRVTGDRLIKEDAYMDLPYRVNQNFQKELFTKGFFNSNYLGFAHKSEKTNMFLSFEDFTNEGVIINTGGYKRNSLRINIDHRFNDKFKISISNNLIKTNNNFMGGGTSAFANILLMEPDANIFKNNPDGQQYFYYPNQWSQIVPNPLYSLWRRDSNSKKYRFLGSYKANWKINKWLTFNNEYATEIQMYQSKNYTPFGTYNGLEEDHLTTTNGSISQYSSESFGQTFRSTLQFKKTWNDLRFNGKLSYLYENNVFESLTTNPTGTFSLPDLPSFNYLPGTSTKDRNTEINAQNYFAVASFDYKDRYILDALIRRDGSSLFGENERWQTYYRFSGAYRVTKDLKIKGIEELKLRFAYGIAGQQPGFSYQYETFDAVPGGFVKNTLGNKNLKPSKSDETELGVDISFLDRFYLEATYSKTVSTDQFVLKPLAPMLGGFKFQWINDGTLKSANYEALFNAKIIKKENWKWSTNLTYSKNTSKITALTIPEFSDGPRGAFRMAKDEEYGTMYGWQFVHTLAEMATQLPEGDVIGDYSVNVDGVVVKTADIGTVDETAFHLVDEEGTNKVVKIGNVTPDFRLSATSKVSYKNFSFYMLWKWKKGGDIYNATAQNLVRDLRHPMMDQIYTKPENKKTVNYYQSLYDASALNDFWVEDASYIKLGEVALNYNIKFKDDTFTGKYMKSLKVGVSGSNLLTITDYSGYDPEAGYSGFTFDNFGYPNYRKYTLSLEVKF